MAAKKKRVLIIVPFDETPGYYLLTPGQSDKAMTDHPDVWDFICAKGLSDKSYGSLKELLAAVNTENIEIVDEYCAISY